MLGAATFYNHMRPEVLRTHETIRYESSAVAVRVCPIHQESLDDEGCCPGGKHGKRCCEWWEVHWKRNGAIDPEVLFRASWDDNATRFEMCRGSRARSWTRPFKPERKVSYLAETSYHLRKQGYSHEAARTIAEQRWEVKMQRHSSGRSPIIGRHTHDEVKPEVSTETH